MESSGGYGSRRKGIQMGNILGDPFALATTSMSMAAWVIAFIAYIVAAVKAIDDPNFNRFPWWSIFYSLLLNIFVFVVIASDTIHTYHVALTSYCTAGMVLCSIAIHSLVYHPIPARQAAAAGFIILSIVQTAWAFYFGSTPSSTPRAFLDSFALTKESATMHRQTLNAYGGTGRPETSNSVQPPQMYTSAQLNGFENPSPVGNTSQANGRRTSGFETYGSTLQPPKSTASPGADTEVVPPTEYPYRAKAIYSYEANPDDANEISFAKHEILEVSDVSGRWWQARKESGEAGIAPSNYLILL
ncbi:Transmembrane osmosensor [Amphichorda felina]